MVLFGVTSIFTNVLVDKAIEMILKRELKRKKKLLLSYIETGLENIFMVELELFYHLFMIK